MVKTKTHSQKNIINIKSLFLKLIIILKNDLTNLKKTAINLFQFQQY